MSALFLSGGSGRGRGGGEREGTRKKRRMNVIFCPSGHSWARAGQVQSTGDQWKIQQNPEKYSAIVGFCLSINNDYGICSTLIPRVQQASHETTSQNRNTCKGRALSTESVGQTEGDRYLVSKLAQPSRHRVIEFSQMSPTHIISQTRETGCGSTYFIAFIIGGGPSERSG